MQEQVRLDPDSSEIEGTELFLCWRKRKLQSLDQSYFGMEKKGWKSDLNPK